MAHSKARICLRLSGVANRAIYIDLIRIPLILRFYLDVILFQAPQTPTFSTRNRHIMIFTQIPKKVGRYPRNSYPAKKNARFL